LAFRYRPKGDEILDHQNDDGECKTILGFIGTGLNNLTLQYSWWWWWWWWCEGNV